MRIYLDTSDLINIFERSRPCKPVEFEKFLLKNSHELILSFLNVIEISAPLLQRNARTNVMFLLNRIERLPIKYISKVFKLELQEAYRVFKERREYKQVFPFFDRFDDVVEDRDTPPTRNFLNFPLSETVFTLWTIDSNLFKGFNRNEQLQNIVNADRSLSHWPNLRDNFVKTIGFLLRIEGITIPTDELKPFAYWIYDLSSRCPAIRLGYEVYHKFIKNVGDISKEGDIPDFGHTECVPYVNLITFDRRMFSYVNQASKDIGLGYEGRIFRNIEELMAI